MEKLIQLLSDGEFHSGEELGNMLGVSRAAVWKKVQSLMAIGLTLDAVRGKGYRLPAAVELLNGEMISPYLSQEAEQKVALDLKISIPSTNDAVRSVKTHNKPVQVCIAEHQSAGRGRRGRHWASPFGTSLYYSLLCHNENGFAALDGLSLAVGLTVLQTLESQGVTGLCLKWPNDILARTPTGEGQKLGGVLLEVSGDPVGACEIVIGIGINLVLPLADREGIDQPVTDVQSLSADHISKNELAGRLTTNMIDMLQIFQEKGFSAFKDAWQSCDAFAGQRVALSAGDQVIVGVAAGVSESGAVLITDEDGVITAHAGGEISLRRL